MEQQLNGPERDEALAIVRAACHARPTSSPPCCTRAITRGCATWCATARRRSRRAAHRSADRGSGRRLPRPAAQGRGRRSSSTCRSTTQEALLKAMAQEDVAALLNDMAPDDRTMFLEELPATATRQLLALLTPKERAVAVTLLGYPEGSIGRLMTPHYVAVRRGLDRARGARLRPRARPGQRNAQRHLRRRRTGPADRRHPHPRVPARAGRPAASPS